MTGRMSSSRASTSSSSLPKGNGGGEAAGGIGDGLRFIVGEEVCGGVWGGWRRTAFELNAGSGGEGGI